MPKFPNPIILNPGKPTSSDTKEDGLIFDNLQNLNPDETSVENSTNEDKSQRKDNICLDTMQIFDDLRKLGFSDKQSDLILKLIKDNIYGNLNNLESKTSTPIELENELYLFEAAQSELRVEIKTSRELDLKNLEMAKNSLETIFNEESEELNNLLIMSKNDSQVMINDQISENTLLQKKIKKLIQDLNNKISTDINSEIKSEIESLRWHTTRGGIMAVLVLVFIVMGGVSISKKLNKDEQPQEIILRTIEPEEKNHTS